MIKVFADRKQKDLKNFWGHIVFHPTNAIEDDWGRLFLDKIAEDKAAKTIRIYSNFEDMVDLDDKGELVFDFSKSDTRIDYLVSKGFNLFIAYAFMPNCISKEKDPELLIPRYKDADFYCSYPSEYSKWEEICRAYTQHLVDRYGESTVCNWRMHCYNEPDGPNYFYRNAEDYIVRAKEYCKLYDSFASGVLSVCDKIRIGGPALAMSKNCYEFLEYFLTHIKESGTRLDFISIHSYGGSAGKFEEKVDAFDVMGSLRYTQLAMGVMNALGFENTPIICDEWGASVFGYYDKTKFPSLIFRENEIYSAYFAKMLIKFDELNVPYEEMMLCLSGQHDLTHDFYGSRNFFSKSFYPKPIFNAFVLSNKLGEEKLCSYTSISDAKVSVMPTKHKDGHMSVLMVYADDRFELNLAEKNLEIDMSGLDREYKVFAYVIDKNHSNAYTKFVELGEPQNPSEEVKKQIREAGTLKAEKIGVVSPQNTVVEITAAENSVILLEFFEK